MIDFIKNPMIVYNLIVIIALSCKKTFLDVWKPRLPAHMAWKHFYSSYLTLISTFVFFFPMRHLPDLYSRRTQMSSPGGSGPPASLPYSLGVVDSERCRHDMPGARSHSMVFFLLLKLGWGVSKVQRMLWTERSGFRTKLGYFLNFRKLITSNLEFPQLNNGTFTGSLLNEMIC